MMKRLNSQTASSAVSIVEQALTLVESAEVRNVAFVTKGYTENGGYTPFLVLESNPTARNIMQAISAVSERMTGFYWIGVQCCGEIMATSTNQKCGEAIYTASDLAYIVTKTPKF